MTILSVHVCFLNLVVRHAESEEQLDSADLPISISVGMSQDVKSGFQQEKSKSWS